MKTGQTGFTLVELMIVVAIIGILAAVAVPMYQDYTKKTKIADPISLFEGLKTDIGAYYAEEGNLPADQAALTTLVTVEALNGQYAVLNDYQTTPANSTGTISWTVPSVEAGKIIQFEWDGSKWSCNATATTFDDKYLPKFCRP